MCEQANLALSSKAYASYLVAGQVTARLGEDVESSTRTASCLALLQSHLGAHASSITGIHFFCTPVEDVNMDPFFSACMRFEVEQAANFLLYRCVIFNTLPAALQFTACASNDAGAGARRARGMSNLTSLKLQHIEVGLPPMACIAQQLTELDLEGSTLHTDCSPEESTAFFSSFVQLARANFAEATLDTSLADTQLPSLRELSIQGFMKLLGEEYSDGIRS